MSSKYTLEEKIAGQMDASLALAGGLDGGSVQETTGGRWQPPLEGYEGVWHIRSGERTETAEIEEPSGYRYYEVTRLAGVCVMMGN